MVIASLQCTYLFDIPVFTVLWLYVSGYMSPGYAMGGRFSEKSEVFSFGVLLLEIVSGRRNTAFQYDDQYLSLLI